MVDNLEVTKVGLKVYHLVLMKDKTMEFWLVGLLAM